MAEKIIPFVPLNSLSPLPPEIEILYREMVGLGGARYLGLAKGANGRPDLILFDAEGILPTALPAKEISADKIRIAIAKAAR